MPVAAAGTYLSAITLFATQAVRKECFPLMPPSFDTFKYFISITGIYLRDFEKIELTKIAAQVDKAASAVNLAL